ncbi:MAG: DUF423 domain-containing protein [Gammaproteobacteria bacterium]|nr:DUF423 domain-containing protein [Gammaproteobacteria bacterium]
MARTFLTIGALSGLLCVMLGAFGAHGLQNQLPADHLEWWHKAVDYQAIHSLALLATGLLALQSRSAFLTWSGWSFLFGILIFSGSLYLLALTGFRQLGLLTPLGGLAFICGWGCLTLAAWRLPKTQIPA